MILALRRFNNSKIQAFKNTSIRFSLQNRQFSSALKEDTENVVEEKGIVNRFKLTAEVTISKIFPAGFGWQTASTIADNMGYQATDMGFFLATGAGDFAGVMLGHTLYYALKSNISPKINLKTEAVNGLWLGSAAFCSGFVWQPVVNTLQAASLPFIGVAGGTVAGCGLAFFAGLRMFRTIYAPLGLENADNSNFATDAQLSVAIGGATGAFVGTDVAYMDGAGNFLRPLIGIEEGLSDLQGSITAGASTSLGFAAFQGIQNISYAEGTNWTD